MFIKIIKKLVLFFLFVILLFIVIHKYQQTILFEKNLKKIKNDYSQTKKDTIKYSSFKTGDYDFSIYHDDLKRNYKIHIPPKYNPNFAIPLVMVFHGGAGNMERAPKYFQFNPKADKENFIIVYPEGTGVEIGGKLLGTWNGGDCCGPAYDNNIDDVGFIEQMLEKIENDFNIDTKRIFATGMSNGAIISYRLACEMSDKIAAIAPVASIGHYKNCQPTRQVPILHIHGLDDPCAPYDGCSNCVSCVVSYLSRLGITTKKRVSSAISVPDYLNMWKKINNCSNETEIVYVNKDANCVMYKKCANNADIELCSVKNMGHVWPGKTSYGIDSCQNKPDGYLCKAWEETVGEINDSLSANDIIWDFFKKHHLP